MRLMTLGIGSGGWRDNSNGSKQQVNKQEARHVPRSATWKVNVGEAKMAGEADLL